MTVCKTFTCHWENDGTDCLYLIDSLSDKTAIINKKQTNHNRVIEPCSRNVQRNLLKLVGAYGNDGQNDDEHSGDIPLQHFDYRSKVFSTPIRVRRPRLHDMSSLNQLSNKSSPRKLPDRFLPPRTSSETVIESFKTNKDPKTLSPDERLMRTQFSNLDAFSSRKKITPCITGPIKFPLNRIGSGSGSILTLQRSTSTTNNERQVSIGTIWRVGGLAPPARIHDERNWPLGSNTNAPLYTTSFSSRPKTQDDIENLENRLAEALSLDRASRIFDCRQSLLSRLSFKNTKWNQFECQWVSSISPLKDHKGVELRNLPMTPFKILDAPNLRDDFYCSVLAYSATCHTLAVALGPLLYAWSEIRGVHLLNSGPASESWLTSLAFSSNLGKKSILGFGRSDGLLSLMSLYDTMLPRFEVQQPFPIACLTWRPQVTNRPSQSPVNPGVIVKAEDLLIGDETGDVYYYSIEWPDSWEVARDGWSGSMTLLARISVHSQQICGLSFSTDGSMFATGGNDNLCCLFQTNTVQNINQVRQVIPGANVERNGIQEMRAGSEKHRWIHGAAVKAIAFCPWKEGLLATGGGSNDKCIHFYHAPSGSCLATISVSAQVTSLIWSNTRKEICATFGYSQPEHPYRIAVFSWPDCKQVSAIPWEGEHRALYAIPYHGGPDESQNSRDGSGSLSRTAQEGCIVVASSDESVKFHEVWTGNKKSTAIMKGLLGGSDVIEGLESIDKEGEIIR